MEDEKIVEIEEYLTFKSISKIAILYLGLEFERLDKTWEEGKDVERYVTTVIKKWRDTNKDDALSKLQKFADILYDSGEVDHAVVEDILKVKQSKNKVEIAEPKLKRKLSTRILGQLADVIPVKAMPKIAVMGFKKSFAKVDNTSHGGNGYWWFTLSFLVEYAKKPDSSPEKLREILLESGEVNPCDVDRILRAESTSEVETKRGAANPSTSSSPDGNFLEEKTQEKAPAAPVKKEENDSEEPNTSEVDGGMQPGEEPTTGQQAGSFPLPADLLFPKGGPCDKLDNSYDWLKLDKIRRETDKWKDSTTPVVVAILDTGIYEDHKDLKGKILTDQSKCFLPDKASQEDLTKDTRGHGTMVAGIIARFGPENVRIINLKVFYADGKGSTNAIVKALGHVFKLKLKDADGREYGVDIINMSLGQFPRSKDFDDILPVLAIKKIIVAAAGNEGAQKSNAVNHPAKNANVIAVGAHDVEGHISGLSSRGEEVKILCPGEAVVSTCSPHKKGLFRKALYFKANGTSLASPYAAAVAAHVLVAMEAKTYRDAKLDKKSDAEAKQEGLEVRERLCSNAVMKGVLEKMTPRKPGRLLAYEEGFWSDETKVSTREQQFSIYTFCEKTIAE